MNETQNQRNPDGKENTFNGRKKEKKSWSFHVLDTLQNYYWKENGSFPLSLLTVDLEECLTKHGYVLYGD